MARFPAPRLLAAALLAGACLGVQAQPGTEQGRVIASEPITEQGRTVGYSVTYEYAGRTYTTRTDGPPGPTIPVQASPYGVTTYPVAPQPELADNDMPPPQPGTDPAQVVPEPGVVVSGAGVPYGAPPPAYPAPVYVAPAYAAPYAYPAPWVYPPVGVSLNLGYARGWHHGHRHWHRGWR